MENIKWLFFDMGGVILNDDEPERLRQKALFDVLVNFLPGLTMTDVYNAWMISSQQPGSVRLGALRELMKDSEKLEAAEAAFKEVGNPDYQGLSFIRPDAKPVLEVLSKKYNLGIAANQSNKTVDRLRDADILSCFSHQKMSAEIGLEKPDPNFFLHILNDCGTTPQESVLIDDNWFRGLLPAKKLGMTAVLYKRDFIPYPKTATPDFAINTLQELLNIF